MNAESISTAELARLNWRLGLAYAEAVRQRVKRHKIKLDLIGCHGQTLYHQARAETYAGRRFACTWQAGEAQTIAAALGVPVVSNFRPADMLPVDRARRLSRCWTTCSLRMQSAGACCRTSAASPT